MKKRILLIYSKIMPYFFRTKFVQKIVRRTFWFKKAFCTKSAKSCKNRAFVFFYFLNYYDEFFPICTNARFFSYFFIGVLLKKEKIKKRISLSCYRRTIVQNVIMK
jgi:hypothetical protein